MKTKNSHKYKVTFTEDDVLTCMAVGMAEQMGTSYKLIAELLGLSEGQVSYRLKLGHDLDGLPKGKGYVRLFRTGENGYAKHFLDQHGDDFVADVSARLGSKRIKPRGGMSNQRFEQEAPTAEQAAKILRLQKRNRTAMAA